MDRVRVGSQNGRVLIGIPRRLVLRSCQALSCQAAETIGQSRSEESDVLVARRWQRREAEPAPRGVTLDLAGLLGDGAAVAVASFPPPEPNPPDPWEATLPGPAFIVWTW
jgi:hypothetical protein